MFFVLSARRNEKDKRAEEVTSLAKKDGLKNHEKAFLCVGDGSTVACRRNPDGSAGDDNTVRIEL